MIICDEYCEVKCNTCRHYNWRNNYCVDKRIYVKKDEHCTDFHCRLSELDREGIRELVTKDHKEGRRK
jgi:hypothetical protein